MAEPNEDRQLDAPGAPDVRPPDPRRRAARAAVAVLAVLALAAVVLLGVTVLRHRTSEGTAAAPPSPLAPSATSTPSAAAVATPTGTTPSPTPTVEPGLPPYRQLTAAVLATAGPGWIVGVYEPASDVDGNFPRVLVISPDGVVYRAADPKGFPSEMGWYLEAIRWQPGARTVVVETGSGDSRDREALDLLSGDLVADTRGRPETMTFGGLTADGSEVWSSPYGRGLWVVPAQGAARQVFDGVAGGAGLSVQAVDPSGRYVAVTSDGTHDTRVLDVSTGRVGQLLMPSSATRTCSYGGWADPARILMLCAGAADAQLPDAAVTLDVSGSTPVRVSSHQYAQGERRPWTGPTASDLVLWVGHDRLLATGTATSGTADRCTLAPAWLDSEGRATAAPAGGTALPGLITATADAGTVYIGEWSGCPDAMKVSGLTSVDVSGKVTVLIPHTPDADAGRFQWAVAR